MKLKAVIMVNYNNGKNSPPPFLGWLLKKIIINNRKKNAQSKALQIAIGLSGVESVSLQGKDYSQLVVVGEGIDSVNLTRLLRKKVGFASITSVSEVKKPKQETKPSESGIQSMVGPTYQAGVPYHYQVGFAELTSVSPLSTECLFPNSVRSISLHGIKSKRLVDTTSIASIFPPDRSDTKSDTTSEFNESSTRFSCSIDTIFPPAWSPSQSPPRISFSTETFFPPARSPSQSDSSENYEEIFPIDPFIATSSRRTRPIRVVNWKAQVRRLWHLTRVGRVPTRRRASDTVDRVSVPRRATWRSRLAPTWPDAGRFDRISRIGRNRRYGRFRPKFKKKGCETHRLRKKRS